MTLKAFGAELRLYINLELQIDNARPGNLLGRGPGYVIDMARHAQRWSAWLRVLALGALVQCTPAMSVSSVTITRLQPKLHLLPPAQRVLGRIQEV